MKSKARKKIEKVIHRNLMPLVSGIFGGLVVLYSIIGGVINNYVLLITMFVSLLILIMIDLIWTGEDL